ncbi:hypothetical protein OSB04_000879 [Centaurea solstitialis]|uniref:Cytochrome P450 n=1 Tax=Centaurea solstitialis TaxID=347529 RepID=A0AA38TPZ3_9ASTR|nr:hypothetical protein OSB04_000879 [Centaurea solstitialis]
MEGFPQFLPILGLFISLLIFSYKRSKRNNTIKSVKLAPEPSGALPLIGHLHFLRAQSPVAKILEKIADDYGPAYSLRLGSRQALVVSNWQMAKDCLNPMTQTLQRGQIWQLAGTYSTTKLVLPWHHTDHIGERSES